MTRPITKLIGTKTSQSGRWSKLEKCANVKHEDFGAFRATCDVDVFRLLRAAEKTKGKKK